MSDLAATPSPAPQLSAYRLAAGMLWHDRALLVPLFLMLLSPVIVEASFPAPDLGPSLLLLVAQRVVQLLFLWIIGRRWIKLLTVRGAEPAPGAITQYFALGLSFWAILMIPLLIQLLEVSNELQLIGLVLFVPLVIVWMRYYFYLMPFLLGVTDVKRSLAISREITQRDPRAPWATMLAPFSIVVAGCGLLYTISPDGRVAFVQYAAMVAAEFFWPLCCYLWLAFSMVLLADNEWHAAKLDPYRQARFATVTVGAPTVLERMLYARSGGKILVLAALLWIANRVQVETLPPAPRIEVVKVAAEGAEVKLTVRLSDSEYHFRGFHPVYLTLAGEERHPVSTAIKEVESAAGGRELLYQIPQDLEQIEMTLTFETNRSGDALKSLEDLYLWYRLSKLSHINLR